MIDELAGIISVALGIDGGDEQLTTNTVKEKLF
jgi:hypothetical protein